MKKDIQVVFFDLFFTLVTPKYNGLRNENDVLGITREEWERYAEDYDLYLKRATSKEISPKIIIESIIDRMEIDINETEIEETLKLREERLKKSLIDVDCTILDVLSEIKKSGKKMCLISNSDVIDVMHWKESPLYNLFDDAIFSYEVGYLKPQIEIYKIALKKMKAEPKQCIFIGDGGSNELEAAKSLGMKTILTEYLLERDNSDHNIIRKFADYCTKDFKEVRDIILN